MMYCHSRDTLAEACWAGVLGIKYAEIYSLDEELPSSFESSAFVLWCWYSGRCFFHGLREYMIRTEVNSMLVCVVFLTYVLYHDIFPIGRFGIIEQMSYFIFPPSIF